MKLKDIIPSAIMLEGSEFNELVMTDLGRAKFDTIYGFKGSFKYGEQDLTKVLDIMKKSVETDKYIINARGFIAGLSCEFTGEIMIGVKKQSNPDYPDWIGERIYDHLLKEYGASDLMEALFEDDNGHENLTDFPTKEQFRDEMMRVHKKSEEQ